MVSVTNQAARLKLPVKWLASYYDPIMGTSHRWVVCVQCVGLRNRGLLPERGRHFIYLIMPSSVYGSPFISIEYLPIYFDQGHKRAQMFFSTMMNRWCPQALQGSVVL